ncbi:MAG: hypothetical protein AAGF32_07065 [Pseudomonadota bacterium]
MSFWDMALPLRKKAEDERRLEIKKFSGLLGDRGDIQDQRRHVAGTIYCAKDETARAGAGRDDTAAGRTPAPVSGGSLELAKLPGTASDRPHQPTATAPMPLQPTETVSDSSAPAGIPARVVNPVAPTQQPNEVPAAPGTLPDITVSDEERIDGAIWQLGAAVTSLDRVENQLVKAKCELQRLNELGEPVDLEKACLVIELLAREIHDVVHEVGSESGNILKDNRLQIRFSDANESADSDEFSFDLTLISLNTLAELRQCVNNDAQQLEAFVDRLARIVNSNTNILSSLLLALCASRDYASEVTGLASDARLGMIGGQSDTSNSRLPGGGALPLPGSSVTPTKLERPLAQGRTNLLALLQNTAGD